MKKLFRNAALLSLCAVTFVGCGNSKVDFATFKTKAEEALKTTVEYTTAKITGSAKIGGTTLSVDCEATVKDRTLTPKKAADALYTTAISLCGLGTFIGAENTDLEYYAGSTFEIKGTTTNPSNSSETSTASYAWNENGLITYMNSSSNGSYYDLKVSYSK